MNIPPLYILRHGQTEWNATHRIQGGLDSNLTELGQAQAQQQREILGGCDLTGFDALCSPQGRAFHTASIAVQGLVPAIRTDDRLVEIGVGKWEGISRTELLADWTPDESEESALALYDAAPGGEGFAGLHTRCHSFLSSLKGPAVLITHGITSRMLRLIILGRDISEIGDLPGGQGVVYHMKDATQKQLTIGG
ncbi:MAG: histidine phosphatase family protein [Sulfitobacter sp.]